MSMWMIRERERDQKGRKKLQNHNPDECNDNIFCYPSLPPPSFQSLHPPSQIHLSCRVMNDAVIHLHVTSFSLSSSSSSWLCVCVCIKKFLLVKKLCYCFCSISDLSSLFLSLSPSNSPPPTLESSNHKNYVFEICFMS